MAGMVYVVSTCGFGSFGDDCTMEPLRTGLGGVWPETTVAIHHWDPVDFEPEREEAVVIGGGGLLYHFVYGPNVDSLGHYLRYPAAIEWFDKPTYALGLGVQGRLERADLEPWLDTLNRMELRTVRDPVSREILEHAGVTEPIIESADLSYLMDLPSREPGSEPSRPVLGVALSQPFKGVLHDEFSGLDDRVRDALVQLQPDFDIRFYSFDRRNEGAIPGPWPESCRAYDPAEPDAVRRFAEAIGECDLLVTSRFHGVILAARMGVPFVPMGVPGEKVDREARALGSGRFLSYRAGGDAIEAAVRGAWAERTESTRTILAGAAAQEGRARRTFTALGQVRRPEPAGCPA